MIHVSTQNIYNMNQKVFLFKLKNVHIKDMVPLKCPLLLLLCTYNTLVKCIVCFQDIYYSIYD